MSYMVGEGLVLSMVAVCMMPVDEICSTKQSEKLTSEVAGRFQLLSFSYSPVFGSVQQNANLFFVCLSLRRFASNSNQSTIENTLRKVRNQLSSFRFSRLRLHTVLLGYEVVVTAVNLFR